MTEKLKEEEKMEKDLNKKTETYVKGNERIKCQIQSPWIWKNQNQTRQSQLKNEKEDELNNNTVEQQNEDKGKQAKIDTKNKLKPDVAPQVYN